MSDDSQLPWSDNPNAPQIPYVLYESEKYNFAGILITSTFYGIVIVLFFQCMDALLNPLNRKNGIKWGLVVHTATMFSLTTIFTGMTLDIQSISFVDNREFASDTGLPPGPLGYQILIYSKAIGIIPSVAFLLNQFLADGLLLYRCYVIYAMNYWFIAFPLLMYIAGWVVGIIFVYQTSQPGSYGNSLGASTGIPYETISLSLNVLLTAMIVVRLVIHGRNVRNAMGSGDGATGLYKAIVTILVESSALFTVNSLLFIGPWGAGSWVADIFLPILAETQVISPMLIILRVANRRAFTSDTIISGNIGSMHFRSHGNATGISGSETLPDESPVGSVDVDGETPDKHGVGTIVDHEKA